MAGDCEAAPDDLHPLSCKIGGAVSLLHSAVSMFLSRDLKQTSALVKQEVPIKNMPLRWASQRTGYPCGEVHVSLNVMIEGQWLCKRVTPRVAEQGLVYIMSGQESFPLQVHEDVWVLPFECCLFHKELG